MRLDLLHLVRSVRRSPASAGAAIVTLALTCGAGASIFAVVDAVLLTPPPFADPGALVIAGETPLAAPTATPRTVPYATFEGWRERSGSLATLEAFDGTNLTLTELGTAERLSATDVTPGFFTLLGVTPALGRTFDRDDVGRPVAIISRAFWHTKLAADPDVIGHQIVLGGRAHTIIGVLPEAFAFAINPCDIWRPIPVAPIQAARSGYRVMVMARLAPHAAAATLAGALDDVSRRASPPARVITLPVTTAIARDSAKTLTLLAAAAGLAMLIAFINLAGLLMVRSVDRRRELAVRSALGAHRGEIARQLLVEAVALVGVGTIAGILLALWTTPVLARLALEQYGGLSNREIAVSWRVITVVAVIAFACACLSASLPALGAARRSVVEVLRRGATPSTRERSWRRAFVIGEVALAFVLLVSMALLGRTLFGVLDVNPGFDARSVLTLQVSLPTAIYDSRERVASFYSTLQSALQQRLGPLAIAIIDEIPLTGDRGRSVVRADPSDAGREAVVRTASPGYFDVMRIPVVGGRTFEPTDNSSAPTRVVMSQSLAQILFGSGQPIGRRLWLAAGAPPAEVIGIVGDVTLRALDEPVLPTLYQSGLQSPSPSSLVVVRDTRADAEVIAAVREAVARLDGTLPVYNVRSMHDVVAASPGVPARRLLTATFTGFALLAVVLSAIGLFGVAAHDVACRRSELALRIALGADPRRLLSATLGQGALTVGSGLIVGSVLSLWAARGLGSMVYATGESGVLSVVVAAVVLITTGAAAVLPAALRAARTDPLVALRSE